MSNEKTLTYSQHDVKVIISSSQETNWGKNRENYFFHIIQVRLESIAVMSLGYDCLLDSVEFVHPLPPSTWYDTSKKHLNKWVLSKKDDFPYSVWVQWGHHLDIDGVLHFKDGSSCRFTHHINGIDLPSLDLGERPDAPQDIPSPLQQPPPTVVTHSVFLSDQSLPRGLMCYSIPDCLSIRFHPDNPAVIVHCQLKGKIFPATATFDDNNSCLNLVIEDENRTEVMYNGLFYLKLKVEKYCSRIIWAKAVVTPFIEGNLLLSLKDYPTSSLTTLMNHCRVLALANVSSNGLLLDLPTSPDPLNQLQDDLLLSSIDASSIIKTLSKCIVRHNNLATWKKKYTGNPISYALTDRDRSSSKGNVKGTGTEKVNDIVFPKGLRDEPDLKQVKDDIWGVLQCWEECSLQNWKHRQGRQLALKSEAKHIYNPDKVRFLLVIKDVKANLPHEILREVMRHLPPLFFGGCSFTDEMIERERWVDKYQKTVLSLNPKQMKFTLLHEKEEAVWSSYIYRLTINEGSWSIDHNTITFIIEQNTKYWAKKKEENISKRVVLFEKKARRKTSTIHTDQRNGGIYVSHDGKNLFEASHTETGIRRENLRES